MRCSVPVFFLTQNQWERYEVLEHSYTLAASLSLKIWITSSRILDSTGMFLCAQGTCSMTGILTGPK